MCTFDINWVHTVRTVHILRPQQHDVPGMPSPAIHSVISHPVEITPEPPKPTLPVQYYCRGRYGLNGRPFSCLYGQTWRAAACLARHGGLKHVVCTGNCFQGMGRRNSSRTPKQWSPHLRLPTDRVSTAGLSFFQWRLPKTGCEGFRIARPSVGTSEHYIYIYIYIYIAVLIIMCTFDNLCDYMCALFAAMVSPFA
jgi:hypothetical protein